MAYMPKDDNDRKRKVPRTRKGKGGIVKVMGAIGGVLGVIASLLAILTFLTGHATLESFFSPSTPTSVSASHPAPTVSAHSPFVFPYAHFVWFWWVLLSVISSFLWTISVMDDDGESIGCGLGIGFFIGGIVISIVFVILVEFVMQFAFNSPEAGFVVGIVFLSLWTFGTFIAALVAGVKHG